MSLFHGILFYAFLSPNLLRMMEWNKNRETIFAFMLTNSCVSNFSFTVLPCGDWGKGRNCDLRFLPSGRRRGRLGEGGIVRDDPDFVFWRVTITTSSHLDLISPFGFWSKLRFQDCLILYFKNCKYKKKNLYKNEVLQSAAHQDE